MATKEEVLAIALALLGDGFEGTTLVEARSEVFRRAVAPLLTAKREREAVAALVPSRTAAEAGVKAVEQQIILARDAARKQAEAEVRTI